MFAVFPAVIFVLLGAAQFEEITKIQMIVSKDGLVARSYCDGHFNNLPIQANKNKISIDLYPRKKIKIT